LLAPIVCSAVHLSAATVAPGIPCIDLGVQTGACTGDITLSSSSFLIQVVFNLLNDPGSTNLGIFVVPGDVVLFERPNGSLTNPAGWSDVVHFQNIAGVNGSTATMFADAENGVILPPGFLLSANALGIVEVQTGTGTDADFTTYVAGSATYLVHSDAALTPEPGEPQEGVPEPSTVLLIGSGLTMAASFLRRRVWRIR
jgi:hypothetical protein